MKKKFGLFLFSILMALVIGELLVRSIHIYVDKDPSSSYWHYAGWIERHDSKYQQTTGYANVIHDTLYGWILGADIKNAELGNHIMGGMYYATTNHNRTRITSIENGADTNTRVIITLGNSFTFGDCVNDSETYPAQLQKMLPVYKVVNLGVPGWGLDQMYLRLKNEIALYHPSYVIVECFYHDMVRAHMNFHDYLKPYFIPTSNGLELKGVPVPEPAALLKQKHSKLLMLLRTRFDEYFNEVNFDDNDILCQRLFDSIVNVCVLNKAVPLFLYLPSQQECISGVSDVPHIFTKAVDRNRIKMLNPVPQIATLIKSDAHPERNFTCHFSPIVNYGMAETVGGEIHFLDSTLSY